MALAGVLFLAGCTPEDEFECPAAYTGALSADEELLVGNWKLSGLEGSLAIDLTDDDTDNALTDLYSQIDACMRGARYVLSADRELGYFGSRMQEDVCEEELLFGGSWRVEGNILSIISGCTVGGFELDLDEEGTSFSYTVYEQVMNFKGDVVPMQVTYTYSTITD